MGAGRVLRFAGSDTVPVPSVRVTLHQVGREFSGPIDSTRTDRNGRFRFAFRPDTTALYLASTNYAGIEYFSPPIHTNPARPDTALRLLVSDTASSVPVEVASRHLIVAAPREDGTREVVDLITLRNGTSLTRVTGREQLPTWTTPLPPEILGFSVGQSDFSPEAVFFRDGRVEVFGPVAPGEKDLLLRYYLPAVGADVTVRMADSIPVLGVLLEESRARVSGDAALSPADSQSLGGRSYHRWNGSARAGATLILDLPGPPQGPAYLVAFLVGAVALGLVASTWLALRRRSAAPVAVAPPDQPHVLAREIAVLDQDYAGKEQDVGADAWAGYQRARAALVERLRRLLAEGRDAR